MIAQLLIVEPEPKLRRHLVREFTRYRFQVTATAHGQDALHGALSDPPHVVITALNLPDIDALSLIKQLRDATAIPIIATATSHNTAATVRALSTGADDVLAWPFASIELLARTRALLRRAGRDLRQLNHAHGGVTFDFDLRLATRGDHTLAFTALEWRCLETFASAPKRLLSRDELILRIWGVGDPLPHRDALRALIRRLRRALNDTPTAPVFIETHTGFGYRWLADGLEAL